MLHVYVRRAEKASPLSAFVVSIVRNVRTCTCTYVGSVCTVSCGHDTIFYIRRAEMAGYTSENGPGTGTGTGTGTKNEVLSTLLRRLRCAAAATATANAAAALTSSRNRVNNIDPIMKSRAAA